MAIFRQETFQLLSAGSRQQVSTGSEEVLSITFTADPTNSGKMYVGDKRVDKAADPPQGQPIVPGEEMTVDLSAFRQASGLPETVPLSSFWFDGDTDEDNLVMFALIIP